MAEPINLCACGCGQLCWRTWKRGHHRREGWDQPYEERDCGYQTACWWWLRGHSSGYARICTPGQRGSKLAHRVYYERVYGPIPAGLVLDHLCSNPRCVRPDHMEAVTQEENVRRASDRQVRDWQELYRALETAAEALAAVGAVAEARDARRALAIIALRRDYNTRRAHGRRLFLAS